MADQACFGGYWCPIFLDKITRRTSYSMSSRPHEGSPVLFKIATITRHSTRGFYSHLRHSNARESSSPEINCCNVNSTVTIFLRSRSTTINCCNVNFTTMIRLRNQGIQMFQLSGGDIMCGKFGSYSLWGSTGGLLAASTEGKVGMNKQAYDT